MEPLITNKRAAREWDYIIKSVGEQAAREALGRLGNRKPYPLNIARILGLKLPPELAEEPTSREAAKAAIEQARALLGMHR